MSAAHPLLHRHPAFIAGILLTALFSLLSLAPGHSQNPWIQRVDLMYYDWRFEAVPLLRAASAGNGTTLPTRIVIVDVDEASLLDVGQWPWSRRVLADLVEALAGQGAAVIGFDVVFAEAEVGPVQALLSHPDISDDASAAVSTALLNADIVPDAFNPDRRFAVSMASTDVVLGMFFQSDPTLRSGTLPAPVSSVPDQQASAYIHLSGYTSVLPELMQAASAGGFVSTFGDSDGAIRRSPLVIRHGGHLYPSLSLAMVMAYLFDFTLQSEEASIGDWRVPRYLGVSGHLARTDALGQVMVPFLGPERSFPYVSAAKVLAGRNDADVLDGALVLIGTSAQGLTDLRSTPVGARYPGVEVHANVIHALLEGRFPYRPEWAPGAAFVMLLTVGLLLTLVLPRASPLRTMVVSVGVVGGVLVLNLMLWRYLYLDLPIANLLLLAMLLVVLNLGYSFVQESYTRRRLKSIFDQYVPPEHIEHMMEEPDADHLSGESRELTVLFSDIRSFTSISEHLAAEELTRLLNQYFTPITKTIFDHDGTIDKYVGDLVMAFWGAPVSDTEHASKAVATALALIHVTQKLHPEFQKQGWPAIEAGIGLNTGPMNVGDMGSAYRRAYTVLGDAVNLGSRLESLTKFYGVSILVGERTRELATEFEYRYVDRIQVKGREHPVAVYAPLGLKGCLTAAQENERMRYQAALEVYFQQQWLDSLHRFGALVADYPSVVLYQVYQRRVQAWVDDPSTQPPANWDASFRHTSK